MADIKYDVEAAENLATDALHLPIAEAVPIYEQLLIAYPTAAKFWKQYVEAQMAVNDNDATKHIFSRCLLNCYHIPLWRCYIRFIRITNEKKGVEGLEETRKAFDIMINYVGSDIAAGPVWLEYINFLKSLRAETSLEQTQRMTAVRKAFQKAIVTPTHHVEQLWKDYENFENTVSHALAKGLISEYQPKFNSATAVCRERKKYVDEIDWNMLAIPPTGSQKEEQQWIAWKRLLAFEKSNPQRIDSQSANKRIGFTYEQCLMYLYHYPDIWYDYAMWQAKNGATDSAIKVFQRALKALPESEILKYAFAELQESHGAVQLAKKMYESLLGDGSKATALAHVQYIRFLRRTDGIDAARKYFLEIRESPNCTYQVYVAYAMAAFCLDKDPKMAHNVFEAGLKRFMHEPAYILEYADFLSCVNDDRNIRALFERSLSSLPTHESVEVWKRFTQFEQTYGNLASMLKVEQRRKEALSQSDNEGSTTLDDSLQDVVSRYSFMNLLPCSSKDIEHLSRKEWLAKNMSKKMERSITANGLGLIDKGSSSASAIISSKVVVPDVTQMLIYDPGQKPEAESEETLDKNYYVFLPAELCFVHPLPGGLIRGAQRLPSIMRRVESMLLAIELRNMISYDVPAIKILEALTAASCQETFCYERAELLGDAYLKWVVSRFLFLKYPQKHEGQLTRMRQQMVSNMIFYQHALTKGLQSYIQDDRFAPSQWAAPGVLPVYDEDSNDENLSLFDEEKSTTAIKKAMESWDGYEDAEMEDTEVEGDSSSYRVLSSKTLADVVEALIGVYFVEGKRVAANHYMKWIGIEIDTDPSDHEWTSTSSSNAPQSVLRSVDFDALEGSLNYKFKERSLLVEAITHASCPASGVSSYQRLEFVGDEILDDLITKHLYFSYTDLPPGRLTDLRAAAVNNENFARVAVKHNLHVHLRHGSSALEKQIRDFVKEVQNELSKARYNSFGIRDCKAPKVLGDIVESIAGAIFLDSGRDSSVVWKVFEPLLQPMVTPDTLPMHPVRELQERCQQQAEGVEYRASRDGNLATVEVYIGSLRLGLAQNAQKKMAKKLAARNALMALKEKELAEEAKEKANENGNKKKKKNGDQAFTKQTLNDICLRRNWPMPLYRCVDEGGPAHAKRFIFAVRVETSDKGWTDECVGEPMPSVKKAQVSAATLLLELLNKWYPPQQ